MTLIPTQRISTHPGALLLEQIVEMGLTVHGVAQAIGLPATRLHEIVHERRGVSAETAIALAEFFEQTPEFWLNAQKVHEGNNRFPRNIHQVHKRTHCITFRKDTVNRRLIIYQFENRLSFLGPDFIRPTASIPTGRKNV